MAKKKKLLCKLPLKLQASQQNLTKIMLGLSLDSRPPTTPVQTLLLLAEVTFVTGEFSTSSKRASQEEVEEMKARNPAGSFVKSCHKKKATR